MIETIRQGLKEDGFTVSTSKLCQWFGVPRRTVYYKPVKSASKVQECFAGPIKAMIEENPSFGYRTVAPRRGLNKDTVQRIFQLRGWQVSISGVISPEGGADEILDYLEVVHVFL